MSPLREAASIAGAEAHLFTPAPAHRVQRDTNTDTPLPPDEPAAANPPDGAIIDYYLAHAESSPITLEILDAHGQLVRKFSSADKPGVTDADLQKQLIPLYWLRRFHALSADAGMHRRVWDLHYPGSYTARLTVGGKTHTASFTVKMDPRLQVSEAALQKKFKLEMTLASHLSDSSRAVTQAGSIRDSLQKISQQAQDSTRDSIQAFQTKLAAVLGVAAGPSNDATLTRVNGQISTLYGQVWQADAEPTAAQSEAGAAAEHDASDAMKRWEALKTADLPALNRMLRGANLPEVQIESDPHGNESVMDEE
jgi:hypothetical protein